MRSDLDHLPAVQQRELVYVTNVLLEGFEKATARRSQAWCRGGKVFKIILFGSYARNDWVDEPENGYQSDYDLLIIVSHPDLTDIAEYWYEIEERILRNPRVRRLVNIIVHTLDEVNRALTRGEYFWTDIARDGILLHDMPGHALASPRPLTPERVDQAQQPIGTIGKAGERFASVDPFGFATFIEPGLGARGILGGRQPGKRQEIAGIEMCAGFLEVGLALGIEKRRGMIGEHAGRIIRGCMALGFDEDGPARPEAPEGIVEASGNRDEFGWH